MTIAEASPAKKPERVERRRSVRHPCPGPVMCRSLGGNTMLAWGGRVCDASNTGIRLWLPRRFDAGMLLLVDFCRPGCELLPRSVRVRNVRREHQGGFILGASFQQALSERELKKLLGNS